jgi:hypothetical protein
LITAKLNVPVALKLDHERLSWSRRRLCHRRGLGLLHYDHRRLGGYGISGVKIVGRVRIEEAERIASTRSEMAEAFAVKTSRATVEMRCESHSLRGHCRRSGDEERKDEQALHD